MDINAESIIIKSTNWIGDVVISLPSIKAIRSLYPDSEITIMCKPYLSEIYDNTGIIDHILTIQNSSLSEYYKTIKKLKSKNYDLGILLQNAINGAILFYFGNIKNRLGYPTDARGIFLNHKPRDNHHNVHQKDRYMGLAKYLGFNSETPDHYIKTPFDGNIGNRYFLFELISKKLKKNIAATKYLIGIAPGAKYGSSKMWGEENYSNLIKKLLNIKDLNILLFGSKEDYLTSERIISRLSSSKRVYNSCGYFSLTESLYIMGESNIFVANDSGAMHLASSRNAYIIAIFGPTIFNQTSPISNNHTIFFEKVDCWPCRYRQCPEKTHKCMDRIKPDKVADTIRNILFKT